MDKRLKDTEPETSQNCPLCQSVAAMFEEEIDAALATLESGMGPIFSYPSPICPHCQKAAAMR